MGIFNFFRKNGNGSTPVLSDEESIVPPKDVFIEEREPDQIEPKRRSGLEQIYHYAETDFEDKGFNDALTNPDFSYSTDNIKLLKYDLHILIKKAYHTYEDLMLDYDFHIESRERAGLIDTVKQLATQKEKLKANIVKLNEISKDYENNTGLVERIELSYKRGFMRGLAALSDNILKSN